MPTSFKITSAPNGARRQKADHPQLPMTLNEIAQTAMECHQAGADEIHLHVREDDGTHSLDVGRYREAISAIQERAPKMSVQVTTEAAGIFSVKQQYDCLANLRPRAASVSTREMARDPKVAARLYALATETGTTIQHIVYTPQCIDQLLAWRATGVVPVSMRDIIFVLGQYEPAILAKPADLNVFLDAVADHSFRWTVCAFGRYEHACLAHAVSKGGDVRIGFENSIHTPDGSLWKDNATSIGAFLNAIK